ncbi:MAG: hypothetical protein ACREKL_08890 [Chthoniobacterales bacterium]
MRRAAWFLALPLVAAAHAEELQADFRGPGRAEITLRSAVDDDHLADPPGYFAPKIPATRVVRSITIENTGSSPITNPDIRINGRPLLPVDDPLDMLGVADAHDLPALFAAWRDRVIHATTELDASRDPIALLNVLGAAYCGDDARALAAITVANGGQARFARLNGHSVIEHQFENSWVLLDGDQNLLYLDWDNLTPVGEAEILSDPLLALRTQVFGRQSTWEPGAAWQNTSRFEFVDHAHDQKTFRLKGGLRKQNWQLQPGEKIVISLARTPRRALSAGDRLRTNPALLAALCEVSFEPKRSGDEKVLLPYPISQAGAGEPVYETAATGSPILCQAVRSQFPLLHNGANAIEWKSRGDLRVTFDCKPSDLKPVPAPAVRVDSRHFRIEAKNASRMWWQISTARDFRIVAPNLDRVSACAPEWTLTPLDETFLANGRHFARAKVSREGVWSDWSVPVPFDVKKPAQPRIVAMEGADGDQMLVRWKPGRGEMLVFGSNRLDFLPDVFGDAEVVRMENGAIRESRPNKNLLATVPAQDGEAYVPIRACYRLIARENGAFSIPSALQRGNNMPTRVLQTRHEKPDGALTGRDVAVEMDIP